MANTNTDALYPEFWAAAFDPVLIGSYNFQNMVDRKYENIVANVGDQVNVPITPDLGTADDWTPGDAITATNITQELQAVTLNKSKKKTIALTGTELSLSPYELIRTYGVPMAKTLLKAVNLDIYLELMKTPYFVDAISGLDEDDIVDAKTQLSTNEAFSDNMWLVASPDDIGAMLKLDAFQHANLSGTDAAISQGQLQSKFGFDIFENNVISTYTPADLTGAVDNVANYAAGATQMDVDAFDDDANPVRVGDMFKITGETGTPFRTITATTTTTSDTTGITFTPALLETVLDNAVITVTASRSLIAFNQNAAAFASRPYATLPENVGVNSSVINFQGIPIRLSVWHDAKLGVNVQSDILYGVKMINDKRVTRVLTA